MTFGLLGIDQDGRFDIRFVGGVGAVQRGVQLTMIDYTHEASRSNIPKAGFVMCLT